MRWQRGELPLNTILYYQDDALVARVDGEPPEPMTCLSGPATYHPIHCFSDEGPLQSCAATP